ncbi:MAG TPA: hypothetical protein EYP18_04585 [Desulfobacterales bacterium]|nr:hypothetical protein [Desulfobacterales bacterium]
MTKTKKYILVIVIIFVFIGSCVFCWTYGFRQGLRAGGFTSELAIFSLMELELSGQMVNANCEGIKIALQNHLAYLENYKDVENSFITEEMYHMDKMLLNVRLARIEEHLGNISKKKEHVEIAQEACSHIHWDDCSEEKMVWFSKETEKSNPINCLTPGNYR